MITDDRRTDLQSFQNDRDRQGFLSLRCESYFVGGLALERMAMI